jgi:hypothetical protein
MRSCMQPCRRGAIAVAVQGTLAALVVILSGPALARMPEFATGSAPTLAPLVREITPSVVNISVRGRVKEENPLFSVAGSEPQLQDHPSQRRCG